MMSSGNETEEFDEGFYVEYEDKDEDNINHDTFDEAKVEYDLFISRGETCVEIWRCYGYCNDDRELVYPILKTKPKDYDRPPVVTGEDGVMRSTNSATFYARVVDNSFLINMSSSSMDNPLGNCSEASMTTRVKLSKNGAIRVRGGLSSDFAVGIISKNQKEITHYWVEAGGKVWDWSQGKNVIMDKEIYYALYKIETTEVGVGMLGRFPEEFDDLPPSALKIIDNLSQVEALALLANPFPELAF